MAKSVATVSDGQVNLFNDLLEQGVIEGNEALDEGTFVDDKNNLVGVAFIITGWTHRSSGMGDAVSVEAVLPNGEKVTFADFSAGIRAQLEDITRKLQGVEANHSIDYGEVVPPKPLYFPQGLRVSSYTYTDPSDGSSKPATTFYLNGSK